MKGMLQQIILGDSYANVVRSSHYVRWRLNLVDLVDRSLIVITLLGFPRASAKKVSVIERGIVIAPVGHMLNGSRTSDCSFEASGLGDKPIRHVAAVAVAADGEAVGVGDT